jgi:DNA-directed RNA polymerase subunit M
MLFCPKCGSLMQPKLDKGKKVFACSCGHTSKRADEKQSTVKEIVQTKSNSFDVVSEHNTTLPMTEEHCPECGHDRAFWWTKQTRASDEPETKFLRCEKCHHTWRDRS